MKFFKSLMLFTAIAALNITGVHALSDEQAIAEGMIPIEQHLMSEMNAALTPGLNNEGVARAARSHRVVIAINKAASGPGAQTLTMYENGVKILKQKISTGREITEKANSGRVYLSTTPRGFFRATKMYQDYLSYTWNAQMPNAVFFIGGIAIHATTKLHYAELGTRASGGCVRTVLETSKLIRTKVMETGRGAQPGQYEVFKEANGRNIISDNTVAVDQISRQTGDMLNEKVNSWDAVIIVYEGEI